MCVRKDGLDGTAILLYVLLFVSTESALTKTFASVMLDGKETGASLPSAQTVKMGSVRLQKCVTVSMGTLVTIVELRPI